MSNFSGVENGKGPNPSWGPGSELRHSEVGTVGGRTQGGQRQRSLNSRGSGDLVLKWIRSGGGFWVVLRIQSLSKVSVGRVGRLSTGRRVLRYYESGKFGGSGVLCVKFSSELEVLELFPE